MSMEILKAPFRTKVGLLCRLRKLAEWLPNFKSRVASAWPLLQVSPLQWRPALNPILLHICSGRMRASAVQCCEVAGVVAYSQPFSVQKSKFGRCARLVDRHARVGLFFSPSFLISPIAIGFRLGITLTLPGDQLQHQRGSGASREQKKGPQPVRCEFFPSVCPDRQGSRPVGRIRAIILLW